MNFDPRQSWDEYVASMSRAFGTASPGATPGVAPGLAFFAATFERFGAAAQTFLDSSDAAATQAEAAKRFGTALREMFANIPLQWSPSATTGVHGGAMPDPVAQPALGATREHQQRWQRMAKAVARMDAAQRTLQMLWSDAMRDAAASFTASLGSRESSNFDVEATRKLYERWIDSAEDAYARMAHGEQFCIALAEYVNAGSQWREDMQASLERAATALDLPTRSEINSLTQRLAELERALRKAPP